MHFPRDRGAEDRRLESATRDECHPTELELAIRKHHFGPRLAAKAVMLYGADHTNDFTRSPVEHEPLANRVVARKDLRGQRLVDDGYRCRIRAIELRK